MRPSSPTEIHSSIPGWFFRLGLENALDIGDLPRGALDGRDPVPEEAKDADADFSGDVAIMSLCEVLDGACARLPSLWSERGSRAEVRTDLYEQTGDTRFHKAWVELTNEKEY